MPPAWIEEMDDESMFGWVVACVRFDGFKDYDFRSRKFYEVKKAGEG